MKYTNIINKLASKFELKVQAQKMSAQPADVEDALRSASFYDQKMAEVGAILGQAKMPDSTSVKISLVVDPKLNVDYLVEVNPQDQASSSAAAILRKLLVQKYSKAMSSVLRGKGLSVAGQMTVGWMTF